MIPANARQFFPAVMPTGEPSACPDAAHLAAFQRDELDEKATDAVAEHIMGCTPCFDQVCALAGLQPGERRTTTGAAERLLTEHPSDEGLQHVCRGDQHTASARLHAICCSECDNRLATMRAEAARSARAPRAPGVLFELVEIVRTASDVLSSILRTEQWAPMAAGVRTDLPPIYALDPALFDGETVALTFEPSADSDAIYVGLVGASVASRRKVELKIVYDDGLERTLAGRDIAAGGRWELTGRAPRIVQVVLTLDRQR
ncbi:MAG: hypothetical protein HY903_22615 [Deltaproteobacteria bacterium]|nr:hypothetical protein [Deltaproteobacteria bacterium]